MLSFYLSMVDSPPERSRLEELYFTYRSIMYNKAYSILKDRYLAEDAVHNSFVSVSNHLHKIHDLKCNKTRNLMIIIVRNAAYAIYNQNKQLVPDENIEDTLPDTQDIQTAAESDETYRKIMELVKSMKPAYSDVLIMKLYYSYSDAEIAEILGITPENVRVRFSRAKSKLIKLMKEVL